MDFQNSLVTFEMIGLQTQILNFIIFFREKL